MSHLHAKGNGRGHSKNVDIELWRFWGITVIMIFHFYQTGIPYGSYHFASGWMFTDMFFYITGYYTYKHFWEWKKKEQELEEIGMHAAIRYTIQRYQKYLPSVLFSTGVMYALTIFHKLEEAGGASISLHQLLNLPIEILCLTSAIPYGHENGIPIVPLNAPLWFISAMLCVLPIFILLCINRKSGALDIVLLSLSIWGLSVNTDRTYITDLIRSLCGLSVGAALFALETNIFHDTGSSKKRALLGHIVLLIVTALTYYNESNSILVRILLIVGLFCILPNHKSFWGELGSHCICRLGDISLSLFVWHWPVATFMKYWLMEEMSVGYRMAIYIALSFTVALVFYGIRLMISQRKETDE